MMALGDAMPSSSSSDHVATFVAGPGAELNAETLARALREAGVNASRVDWLAEGRAADAFFECDDASAIGARLHAALEDERVDAIAQPAACRRKQLLVADMDSTMIEQECLDELADMVGLRARIAAITERAMQGELVFEEALIERVRLLKGVTLAQIETLLARITLTPGARMLVRTMRAHGAHTVLVSGGFAQFTEPVAARIGFHETRANRLEIKDGALTGVVLQPVQGREGKRAALAELRDARGLAREKTLAIGDGANDVDMLREAGLGVAYHAKPKVAEAAGARIDHADLTALLYVQGYRRGEFVE
jgi:phosphoserine phosphatase